MEEMKLIKELRDEDVGEMTAKTKYNTVRTAARIVLFDQKGRVAVIHASKDDYYKIPGGGVEEEEDIILAVHREAKEEAGCEITITRPVGKIIEYRSQHQFKQINYGYIGTVVKKGTRELTQKEKDEAFKLVWVSVEKAQKLFGEHKAITYSSKFMQERDRFFLEIALQV